MTGPSIDIPRLETPRLIMRAPGEADFEASLPFWASERSRFVGGPIDRERAWRGFASSLGHWVIRGYGRWAVEDRETGAYCGEVGLWFPDGWPEPELGWTIMEAAEGRGIAREAADAARAHAYQTLGWTRLISLIDYDNARSIALAERMGAAHERSFDHVRFGRMGIWTHPAPEALS